MRTRAICVALVTAVVSAVASAQWVKTNFSGEGSVMSLAAIGTNLFAGTFSDALHGRSGAYLSSDDGESWASIDSGKHEGGGAVMALAVSGMYLFAGNGAGVYLSTNNGTNWTLVDSGLTEHDVRSLTVSGTQLLAGTSSGSVFQSTNNGTSWTAVNSGLPICSSLVSALALSGTSLFAGTWGGGIFHLTNSGHGWTVVDSGLTGNYIPALAFCDTNFFAGTYSGIYRFTMNGSSWVAVNSGLTDSVVESFAVSGTNLFAGTWAGSVFLSTNSGKSWASEGGLTESHIWSLAVSEKNLFAGGDGVVWRRPLSEMISTSVSTTPVNLPSTFCLDQNYPNPFNPSTTVKFELPKSSLVRLSVFDMLGREVSVLVNEKKDAGVHEVKFDGSALASGVYFYRLQAGDFTQTKRLLLLK